MCNSSFGLYDCGQPPSNQQGRPSTIEEILFRYPMDIAYLLGYENYLYVIVEHFANQMIVDNQKIDAIMGNNQ